MGIGLLVVKTMAEGEEWTNTWGLGVNGEQQGVLTSADIDELRGDVDFTNPATTSGTSPGTRGETSPIAAIIAFHRIITFAPAVITGVYITDGKDQPNSDPSTVYWSQALNLSCLIDVGGVGENRVPLSIAWLINRNPAGYGLKPGRIYMRYALLDAHVRPGTKDGVDWASTADAANKAANLTAAITDSEISRWIGTENSLTDSFIGLPRYAPAGTATSGDLVFMNRLSNFTSHNPVSRQLTRGRKRKAAAGGVSGGVGGA